MNREILFRGKHIHALSKNKHLNDKWIYGYLCEENYIYSSELEDEFLIDPETVCQYTGLTDKNGKKIFDGDVILFEKKKYFVVWLDSIASFVAKPFEKGRCWPCMNVGTMKEAEIIGNIFDNPELMENLERSKK